MLVNSSEIAAALYKILSYLKEAASAQCMGFSKLLIQVIHSASCCAAGITILNPLVYAYSSLSLVCILIMLLSSVETMCALQDLTMCPQRERQHMHAHVGHSTDARPHSACIIMYALKYVRTASLNQAHRQIIHPTTNARTQNTRMRVQTVPCM